MNRREHLLQVLSEECNEVAQRISKALRFGEHEIEPGQAFPLSNQRRIAEEMIDLLAVAEMLEYDAIIREGVGGKAFRTAIDAKKAKVEKFLAYSKELGTLTGES